MSGGDDDKKVDAPPVVAPGGEGAADANKAPKNLRVEYSGEGQTVAIISFDVDDSDKTGELTSAEREVALLALEGKSNHDIAEARHCSVRTVANQLQSVFRKLGIRSRAELAAKATLL